MNKYTVVRKNRLAIAKAIAALPEKYRIPIILREIEEKSNDEIAEIMSLGLGTTKSRMFNTPGAKWPISAA